MATRYIHLPHAIGETVTAKLNNGPDQTIDAYAVVEEVEEISAYGGLSISLSTWRQRM